MKFFHTILFWILAIPILFSQNPISPPGVYIADPTARVWDDGTLWIYGSVDDNCKKYCSVTHHALSTNDMSHWKLHKNIFSTVGSEDGVAYNDKVLYAPDIMRKDSLYYLYYCQPGKGGKEGVAISSSPKGPFMNGQKINVGDYDEIDPTIFIDDDGSIYYAWGQFDLKMARMKPDMKTLDLSTLQTNVITEKEHYFHEGAFMTKRKGIYYLVYADISRAGKPTCLGYATSKSPFGPYTYRGVIIDNDQSNPVTWNNHGSIAAYKNQWYVFYHRPTHNCNKMRKACVEPITFNQDGSINEVEMTSQGANGPLTAFEPIEAEWACLLFGEPYIDFDDQNTTETLTDITCDSRIVYKYIDFGDGATSLTLKLDTGDSEGNLIVKIDHSWHKTIANTKISPDKNSSTSFQEISVPVEKVTGIHAVHLIFRGDKDFSYTLDWFRFEK